MRIQILISLVLVFSASTALAASTVPNDTTNAHYTLVQVKTHDGLNLQGHLATPKNFSAPYPAVLLLVGSGPSNRYENLPGIMTADGKPTLIFQPIEQALLDAGIAVMAYDKRGVTPIDATFFTDTVDWTIFKTADADALAADALAAFDVLAAQPQVDVNRIGLLGHSEGTLLALKIAEKRPAAVKAFFMLGLLGRAMKDVMFYQGVTNPLRYFYALDDDHDGLVNETELNLAAFADPVLGYILGGWKQFGTYDHTGDGQVSLQEFSYVLETGNRQFTAALFDKSTPWPDQSMPREWFQQYYNEGPYLPRALKLCAKIHLFQGEIDVETPFEDALELNDGCLRQGTPLASFISYPEMGHGFSPRVGYKKVRDTVGPATPKLAADIAGQARKALLPAAVLRP